MLLAQQYSSYLYYSDNINLLIIHRELSRWLHLKRSLAVALGFKYHIFRRSSEAAFFRA